MIKTEDCIYKYGTPKDTNKSMVLWNVPDELRVGAIPKRIYCNEDLIKPLTGSFRQLIITGRISELKTWDGCFNIRKMSGSNLMSLHSWGVAVDMNAVENGLGQIPKLSKEFVSCFTSNNFDWGGNFTRKDGMHFQLSHI